MVTTTPNHQVSPNKSWYKECCPAHPRTNWASFRHIDRCVFCVSYPLLRIRTRLFPLPHVFSGRLSECSKAKAKRSRVMTGGLSPFGTGGNPYATHAVSRRPSWRTSNFCPALGVFWQSTAPYVAIPLGFRPPSTHRPRKNARNEIGKAFTRIDVTSSKRTGNCRQCLPSLWDQGAPKNSY